MTKTEMIARLGELSALLGRDIDTSGTVAELEIRLLEAEEELASLTDDPDVVTGAASTSVVSCVEIQPGTDDDPSGVVLIRTTKTLQLNIFSKGRWKGDIVKPGREVFISADDAGSLGTQIIRV